MEFHVHIGEQSRVLADGLDRMDGHFATQGVKDGRGKPIAINASLHGVH